MAKNEAQQPQTAGPKRGQMTLWFSVAFVILIIMSLPTVVVIFFGLLPTIVSGIVDRTPNRNATFCIGGMNLCGVFPYMIELWVGDNSMAQAMNVITDVFSLLIIYGAAGLGWMIFQSLPPIVATFVTVIAQSRISTLRTSQRKLIEEWGDDVGTPQDVLDTNEQLREMTLESPAANGEFTVGSSDPSDTDALLDGIDNLLAGGGAGPATNDGPTPAPTAGTSPEPPENTPGVK